MPRPSQAANRHRPPAESESLRAPLRAARSQVRAALPWLAWVAVVWGMLAAAGTTHETSNRVAAQMRRGELPRTFGAVVEAVRVYLTDEADEYRYVSYINAALGRAYQPYYVRPLDAWNAQQLRENTPPDNDAPLVHPDAPLWPYRDFLVEYPIGFFLWAAPPAWVSADVDGYRLAFNLWMAALATLGMGLAVRMVRGPRFAICARALPWWGAGAAFGLGVLMTHRYDAAVGLLLVGVAYAALRGRPWVAGAALGLAIVSKGMPALAAPGLALWYLGEGRRKALAAVIASATAVVAAGVGLTYRMAGSSAFDSVAYHAGRPLQLESTMAAAFGLVRGHALEVVQSHGSFNIVGPGTQALLSFVNGLNLLAVLAACGAAGWLALGSAVRRLRVGREATLFTAMILPLVAFMVTAKVFSPQYLVWLMPLGLVASAARSRVSLAIWVTVCVLSQVIYPAGYGALRHLEPWACAAVLLRNTLLAFWAGGLWCALARRSVVAAQSEV